MNDYAVTSYITNDPHNPITFISTMHTTHNALWALRSQLIDDMGFIDIPLSERPEYRQLESITTDQCEPGSTDEHLVYMWDFNQCTYMVTEV